jgi:hypothetical protein
VLPRWASAQCVAIELDDAIAKWPRVVGVGEDRPVECAHVPPRRQNLHRHSGHDTGSDQEVSTFDPALDPEAIVCQVNAAFATLFNARQQNDRLADVAEKYLRKGGTGHAVSADQAPLGPLRPLRRPL